MLVTQAKLGKYSMRIFEMNPLGGIVNRAKTLAAELHKHQKYGVRPYIVHLAAVAHKVQAAGGSPELIAAAWLHDALEDTPITREELRAQFGDTVADVVWAVTGEGHNRKYKLLSVIDKIANTPGADLVKSADRLCNTKACIADKLDTKAKMYRDEHKHLGPVLGNNPMARELYKIFAQMD